jgi:hypothetical protein
MRDFAGFRREFRLRGPFTPFRILLSLNEEGFRPREEPARMSRAGRSVAGLDYLSSNFPSSCSSKCPWQGSYQSWRAPH